VLCPAVKSPEKVQGELKILNSTFVNCNITVFCRRLDFLRKLNTCWSNCEDVEIVLRKDDVSPVNAQEKMMVYKVNCLKSSTMVLGPRMKVFVMCATCHDSGKVI